METFVTSIKQKYRERLINREEQWPPCHSDKLVRLELVEREKGEGYSAKQQRGKEDRYGGKEGKAIKRTPLAYSDLFKVKSGKRPVRKVLVEGDAGIGKTTLCIAVSEDWANEKLFQQFELVLHLPLQMKVVASAGSLSGLLKLLHPSPRICDSVARYIEDEEGKRVLIIADGWDELSASERAKGSFLYQLLFEAFPFMSVLVTSRPFASASLSRLSCIEKFVEIQGFNNENIKEYIESEFASDKIKATSLLEQLEYNPLVESVCSVPLNCAIVCHLWHILEEALPTTMTELYTKIILNVILRNIQKAGMHKDILDLSNFDALPTDLQESWWLLCEFAYQALKNDQIVFTQKELAEFFPQSLALNEQIFCFGLLQSAESTLEVGHGLSFHFLHLTFQEYLAALHLVKRLVDTCRHANQPANDDVFESDVVQEHFAIVWRFFFGIYFNVLGCSNCDLIKPYLSYIQDELVRCHCAFEARNLIIETYIINSFDQKFGQFLESPIRLEPFATPNTAHDCTAVLYVINKIQECHHVVISFGNCHVGEKQIKTLTNTLAKKDGKLQIASLDLSGNKLTCESWNDLLQRASSAFQPHRRLDLGLSYQGLLHLNLSDNILGVSGLQALGNAVNSGLLACMKYLYLSSCLTDNADTNAGALVTFLKSLSDHCPNLDKLDLSDNNLGVPGASALAIAISQRNRHIHVSPLFERKSLWLKSINLSNTNLGDEGLCIFIKKLEIPYIFDNLFLQNNGIHITGLTCLVNMVNSDPWFEYMIDPGEYFDYIHESCWDLDIRDNPIGIEGIIAVSELLSGCDQYAVHLCNCSLTTTVENNTPPSNDDIRDVGRQLCQISTTRVGWLSLDGNCFTGERIHILAGFIHLCECLCTLCCADCNITSDDLIKLLEILLAKSKASHPHICSQLCVWYLNNNEIGDRGVSALMRHVPSLFPCLGEDDDEGVFLGGNPVSSEAEEDLELLLYFLHCKDDSGSDLSASLSDESAREEEQEVQKKKQQEDDLFASLPSLFPGPQSPKTLQLSESAMTLYSQLDEVIDFGHGGVSKHLGQTADTMYEWEGPVAEQLGLTQADIAAIKTSQSTRNEGRGDPQVLPLECAIAGASLPIADETDHNRKRSTITEGDVQKPWPLLPQCIEQSQGTNDEKDLGPPPRKRQFVDDLQDVEHRFVDLIKWEDENGFKRELRIYSKIAHKWRQIATQLGFELGEIESIYADYRTSYCRITIVLGRWFENAKNLPKVSMYPKSWQGLIKLLEDAELGEVAEELKRALSSPWNSVRDYLS